MVLATVVIPVVCAKAIFVNSKGEPDEGKREDRRIQANRNFMNQ